MLEAAELGAGASTRNGGGVSGGMNIGKSFTGKVLARDPEVVKVILASGHDAFSLIETLIEREGIDCYWEKNGRFVGAWTPKDYKFQESRVATSTRRRLGRLHGAARAPARGDRVRLLLRRHGGGALGQAASGALLQGPARRGAPAQDHDLRQGGGEDHRAQAGKGWRIATTRGDDRGGRGRHRDQRLHRRATPKLKRRLIPVASHIIATEELPADLARSLIPKGRTLADTKRVLCYYRMSPDNKRVIFGGRARFTQVTPAVSAPMLHRFMPDRLPQLKGIRVTHAWTGNVAFTLDALPHMGMHRTACTTRSAATAAAWR